MANKPANMTDEMWAAVCIIMEDNQISSFKELTESHKAVITRMDEMENKWAETRVGSGDVTQVGSEGGKGEGRGEVLVDGKGNGPQSGGEGSPPPIVESGSGENPEGGEKKGSGRGGKMRWYEREGYAK